jgi:hypothetical protein
LLERDVLADRSSQISIPELRARLRSHRCIGAMGLRYRHHLKYWTGKCCEFPGQRRNGTTSHQHQYGIGLDAFRQSRQEFGSRNTSRNPRRIDEQNAV